MICTDRRITIREIVEEFGCGHSVVDHINHSLGYRKVCATWIPHHLTAALREKRLDVCSELLAAFPAHEDTFFGSICTGDETKAYLYDPDTKHQSIKWRHSTSHKTKAIKKPAISTQEDGECLLG